MGAMTFLLPAAMPTGGSAAADRARFAGGYDRIPFPTQVHRTAATLRLARSQNESGSVAVPWPVPGVGFPVTVTATLRERPLPYRLLVELARGKLNQVRNQAADWAQLGLAADPAVTAAQRDATRAFGRAVQADTPAEADAAAADALAASYTAAAALADQFIRTSLELRKQREPAFPTRVGCRLSARPPKATEAAYLSAFTAAHLVPDWAAIEPITSHYDWSTLDDLVEWAGANKLPIRLGPLIDLGGPTLPPWLDEWAGELPSIAAFFCDFVETAVHRYRNRVKDWVVCTGFNNADHLGLTEDDRIRLVVRLVDAARNADPDGRWTVGIVQPWGDYLDQDESTYSPLVFADTLMRTGLPIAGFKVELAAGSGRRTSLLRDGLDTIRLLDLFGVLGTPIDLLLRHPGRVTPLPAGSTVADDNSVRTGWKAAETAAAQAEWGGLVTSVALGMPHVRAVTWERWADGPGGDPPDGLIGPDGRPKPLLGKLQSLRQAYL
jgi:hypothetical protein